MTRRQVFRHLLTISHKGKKLLSNPYYWGFVIAKKIIWLAVAYYAFGGSAQAQVLNYEDYPVVKLRSLDKITARTMTFEAKVGSTVRFGEIFIKVQSCRKPPPVEKSEAAAFLQVWQSNEEKETSKWIFSGWMFASSPALSAMDHPVYDVWVLDCLGRDPEPIPKPEENAAGVPAPATDGVVPDAVPPAVEPDTVKEDVSKEDDPGAYEESVPSSNIPAEIPADAAPVENQDYAPSQDTPEKYDDETPVDDSSPTDDTIPAAATPVEAAPEPEPVKSQEFEGIY